MITTTKASNMNTINNKKIAIIGAGPAGLTLGRLLQMTGAEVKIYERDTHKDARPKGATLDLHEESGLKALQKAGLMAAFKASYRPGAEQLTITDKHANIVFEDQPRQNEEISRPEIDRGPLQQILLNSLNPDTVVWNSQFASLSKQGENWEVEFKNGVRVSADVVIGADGANSKIRSYITPIKPFYVGVTAIEGTVYNAGVATPKVNKLLNGGKIFAVGDEKTLIVGSKADGSLMFYIGFKTDEHWYKTCGIDFANKKQVLEWFRETFTGWSEIWDELFENAAYDFVPRPQYCMPLDQTWDTIPGLTMLGDAAHLMPPYAGEGVNMAMLDALELAEHLTEQDFTTTQDAIAAFEKQMRTRASATAKDTLESTAALHSMDAIPFLSQIINYEQGI